MTEIERDTHTVCHTDVKRLKQSGREGLRETNRQRQAEIDTGS